MFLDNIPRVDDDDAVSRKMFWHHALQKNKNSNIKRLQHCAKVGICWHMIPQISDNFAINGNLECNDDDGSSPYSC